MEVSPRTAGMRIGSFSRLPRQSTVYRGLSIARSQFAVTAVILPILVTPSPRMHPSPSYLPRGKYWRADNSHRWLKMAPLISNPSRYVPATWTSSSIPLTSRWISGPVSPAGSLLPQAHPAITPPRRNSRSGFSVPRATAPLRPHFYRRH